MSGLLKVAVFIGVELVFNRLVDLVFLFMSRKHNSVHLRFTKSVINVIITVRSEERRVGKECRL